MRAYVGGEGARQVLAPSAQFSCENETALKKYVIKEEERRNHQVILNLPVTDENTLENCATSCLSSSMPSSLTHSLSDKM